MFIQNKSVTLNIIALFPQDASLSWGVTSLTDETEANPVQKHSSFLFFLIYSGSILTHLNLT